ncbi:MAG: hypothetical protein AAGG46_06825, partial [Planctomycetota bacterium]
MHALGCRTLLAYLSLVAYAAAGVTGPITQYLVLPKVGEYTKAPLHRDPIDALVAAGEWRAPKTGGTIEAADGSMAAWSA